MINDGSPVVPDPPPYRWGFGNFLLAAVGGTLLTGLFALVLFGLFLGIG